ncbi:1-acyl-sn-glycerol-3-phosphate acyltransferase (PlsC) (PDB:1IUQ) [Commensalibacter communis]|uniref:1-acyl-sn-glycerol-3-phosphate acyltransferase (PlsC) n=1 Tax=Commensalibacter communis TaxID=2972786 RepID=A0A9W4TP19_9PROT|nr:MFS transporter [Commensalibacter communis]CAI3939060.1 1-acyl-sn-glycerol-3-phosphate acyltransferase (PlsC) (PDB:1IUQ) [Commensalibacter communis]CAI3941286.1 1-acyl-sn-glycerol-3-phosphate acyltransferase (PlsC) (PDB:1IUQ) [Commensalibacter communis]CAI3944448.1 1-acyl-sn-glycerol-3-phosphate acyltransferase (PlsC) (PDB:1IUQ) [Commensalibacter communis]CAI3945379.1 1-acyl-sn-glycerol-3-phosphate acyltransferase (PlsC) (PDB:1IUQ) [Commensalibacter communis]
MPKTSNTSQRSLWFLCLAQSCGVLNENMIKNAMLVMALFVMNYQNTGIAAIAGGLFILPYACFSATAGQIADKFSKQRVMIAVKIIQIILVPVSFIGFINQHVPILLGCLFLLGTAEAFYCPLKYSIIPEIVVKKKILFGNSLIETSTFIAVLIGMLLGGSLILFPGGLYWVCGTAFILSILSLISVFKIKKIEPADKDIKLNLNIIQETYRTIVLSHKNRSIWLCILGISWFWTIGSVVGAGIFDISSQIILHNGHYLTNLFIACFSLGVAGGSILCSRLLKGTISARFIPIAALGISFFCLDFGFALFSIHRMDSLSSLVTSFTGYRLLIDLTLMAICCGIFSVPLYAIIQEKSPKNSKARIIAGNNIVNAIMMVTGSFIWARASAYGFSSASLFISLSIINLFVTVYIMRFFTSKILQLIFKLYFQIFHKVTIEGMENFAKAGDKVVIISNHTSFADASLLSCYLPEQPAFAIYTKTAQKWWARPFLAFVKTFQIDIQSPYAIKDMVHAVRDKKQKLVIFPEGRLTKTGNLMKIYEGAGIVAYNANAKILPIYINGLQFGYFGRMKGKLPLSLFPRISITIKPPININDYLDPTMSHQENRHQIAKTIERIMINTSFAAKSTEKTIFQALIDAKDIYGKKTEIIEDIKREPFTYERICLGAVLFGRKIEKQTEEGECVGLLLPTSCGAIISFMAVSAIARVPHPINVSTGTENILNICQTTKIKTIISSHLFIEKANLGDLEAKLKHDIQILYLEDIIQSFTLTDKVKAQVDLLRPERLPGMNVSHQSPAVILSTSGSEGHPKAVVLSHHNILTNCQQVASVIDFSCADHVFNAMPIFHSLGLTGATLLPLFFGVRTFHYPNPLHYKTIPSVIYDTDATICFGTDTFLNGWAKYAHPYDFYAMRYIITGGEKVKDETHQLYADKFGVRIFEGYGATESSPVIALNTPINHRKGTVGQFLPGIAHQLVPVSGIHTGGKLLVKGQNIMIGYMTHTNPGVIQPMQDEWYDTGDIVDIDTDGFVTITGRVKRFAKIGGEMISMTTVELIASKIWPEATNAVINLTDDKKGEQLLLITTQQDAALDLLLSYSKEHDIAKIMIPKNLKIVKEIPLFATGKINYPELQKRLQL